MTDYTQFIKSYYEGFSDLAAVAPEPMKRQNALGQACLGAGALTVQVKELIALSMAITMKCQGCIVHHAKAAASAGVTREEVGEMIAIAMLMGGSSSSVYGVEALHAYDAFTKKES